MQIPQVVPMKPACLRETGWFHYSTALHPNSDSRDQIFSNSATLPMERSVIKIERSQATP
jgi:hypothetical protein